MNKYQTIIENFTRWGESSARLHAAIILGSQAREERPADGYSDLDVSMIVDDPSWFLSSDEWLNSIGKLRISFAEDTLNGLKERRVLFDGALDVDFVLIPKSFFNQVYAGAENEDPAIFTNPEVRAIFSRGYRILIDKIGLQSYLSKKKPEKPIAVLPSEHEYINIVNDFWYHSVWTVKKLKRGELWTAKMCLDSYMKGKLLKIIEFHTRALHGANCDTWHNGRFIEEWAEDWIIKKLPLCFSRYNRDEIKSAILSTMDLFRITAVEAGKKLNLKYPVEADEYATAWVKTAL